MGKITVVFNNIHGDERLKTGWGSSILVEEDKELFLFDTGPNAEDLFFNLDILGIDRKSIQRIVISHSHLDHRGALERVLRENPKAIKLYLTPQFSQEALKNLQSLSKNIYVIKEKTMIANRIYIARVKDFFKEENVLVIDSLRGLILLTGCAHPGIYRIFRKIKDDFGKNIYAALGGFHLEYYPSFFVKILGYLLKQVGAEIIGPNHCTGEAAIKIFQQIFKGNFLNFGNGQTFSYR